MSQLHDERLTGIGGSDIAAIVGLSPFRSAFDVYAEKIGMYASTVDTEAMEWGRRLESVVATAAAEKLGLTLRRVNRVLRKKGDPWAIAHLDRLIVAPERGVLEVKTAGAWASSEWGEQGSEQIPDHYRLQVAWYMAVADLPYSLVAVLIAGKHFRHYRVERDAELEEELLNAAGDFWLRVLHKDPPPVDGSEGATRFLMSKYPKVELEERPPTPEAEALALAYLHAKAIREETDATIADLANRLREQLGDAGAMTGEQYRVTWREVRSPSRTDWPAVVVEAHVPADVIKRHTPDGGTTRRFEVKAREDVG